MLLLFLILKMIINNYQHDYHEHLFILFICIKHWITFST